MTEYRVAQVILCLVFLVLSGAVSVYAEVLDEADAHYTAGRYDEAFSAYSRWLAGHCGTENAQQKNSGLIYSVEFVRVLRRAATLADSYQAALTMLSDNIDRATTADQATILIDMARIEEAAGRYEEAQRHFERAAFLIPGKQIYEALLDSGRLLLEFGQYAKADAHARAVISGADDFGLRLRGNLILSRIRAARGEYEAAFVIVTAYPIEKLPAEGLLWLYRLSMYLSHNETADAAMARISSAYPHSPEYGLISPLVISRIVEKPTATSILGLLPQTEDPVEIIEEESGETTTSDHESDGYTVQPAGMLYVQTGSFVDKENAEYFAADLNAVGFETLILEALVKGRRYFRVVVPVLTSELDRTILLLKEEGYEGYPLYSE